MPRRAEAAWEVDGLVLCFPSRSQEACQGMVSQHPWSVVCTQIHLCCETMPSAKESIRSVPMMDARGETGLSHPGFPLRVKWEVGHYAHPVLPCLRSHQLAHPRLQRCRLELPEAVLTAHVLCCPTSLGHYSESAHWQLFLIKVYHVAVD